jgi:His/Glu/Gln/Arg/opine family amino acid ABC transporter permease subunit
MFDFQGYGWFLWEGVQTTLMVGLATIPVAVLLGLLGAWGKLSRNGVARGVANAYTTVVRGSPELVLIILTYYGLTIALQDLLELITGADSTIDIPRIPAGVMTLGLIYGAFATEVFRGAYLAVDRGQIEAASAYGMNRKLMLTRVVLPQMWRFALPGLGNLWMVLIKATSLMYVIQVPELMSKADTAARAVRQPFTFFLAASFIYLAITIVSIVALQRAERWAARGVRRG